MDPLGVSYSTKRSRSKTPFGSSVGRGLIRPYSSRVPSHFSHLLIAAASNKEVVKVKIRQTPPPGLDVGGGVGWRVEGGGVGLMLKPSGDRPDAVPRPRTQLQAIIIC